MGGGGGVGPSQALLSKKNDTRGRAGGTQKCPADGAQQTLTSSVSEINRMEMKDLHRLPPSYVTRECRVDGRLSRDWLRSRAGLEALSIRLRAACSAAAPLSQILTSTNSIGP